MERATTTPDPGRHTRDPDAASSRGTPEVSVVLPCLDEADSVGHTVDEAFAGLAAAGLTGQVIVVDNGSTDGSADIARRHGAIVVHEPVAGYGSALRSGIAAADGDIVVMADADQTYDLTRLGDLVGPVRDGSADLVLGCRLDGSNRGTMPALHRFVGTPTITFLLRRASDSALDLRDSQSGYRAFRADAIRSLGLRATGMEFASEMVLRADHAGLRVAEVDLGYRPRVGESKLATFSDGWRHLQLIVLLAPQLLLVWPGLALFALGATTTTWSLLEPGGLHVGSLEWQPVFFSSILLVVGAVAMLAGTVVKRHSPLAATDPIGQTGIERLSRHAMVWSLLCLTAGVAIDGFIFAIWVSDAAQPDQALALAGLAQSLLIIGVLGAVFSIVYRLLGRQAAYLAEAREALTGIPAPVRATHR